MLMGFNEGFTGAVSQWQSPHNYRLFDAMWNEAATGEGKK